MREILRQHLTRTLNNIQEGALQRSEGENPASTELLRPGQLGMTKEKQSQRMGREQDRVQMVKTGRQRLQ